MKQTLKRDKITKIKPSAIISQKFLYKSDELKKLIIENPELPLIFFAGKNASPSESGGRFKSCSFVYPQKATFLDCEQIYKPDKVFFSKEDFREAVEDFYALHYCQLPPEPEKIIERYDPYWKECIVVMIDD